MKEYKTLCSYFILSLLLVQFTEYTKASFQPERIYSKLTERKIPVDEEDESSEEEEELNLHSRRFYIGGVLPNSQTEDFFRRTINYLNFDGVSVSSTCTLYHVTVISSGSPIRDARLVCKSLIAEGVFAMIIGGGNVSSAATSAVSYTGGFYHIPVIGTAARESAFSDKNIHVSFLRTVPPYSHQAEVWVELLKTLNYKRIVFIHSLDTDGRALLGKLRSLEQTTQDDKAVKVNSVVEFEPGLKIIGKLLQPLSESLVRVFLLFANKDDSDIILGEAKKMNLTGSGSLWVLSEEALISRNVPVGALGLQLKHADNQEGHIADSLRLVTVALRKLHDDSPELIVRPPNTCDREEPWNVTGKLLFKAIQDQVLFNGETGKVGFDSKGDRKFAEYFIINIQYLPDEQRKQIVHIGEFYYDKEADAMQMTVNKFKIVWGGDGNLGETKQPSGISVPRDLKVLTMEEIPFLYTESLAESEGNCSDKDESICYFKKTKTSRPEERCCYGYCVELLKKLADTNEISITLYVSPESTFGERHVGEKGASVWSGMIGELVNTTNGADMIVAPLTINPERAQVIDFSKPFKYQGITILVKKAQRSPDLVSILQPFQFNLWMMLLATVHAIALLVWLLDRLSPMFKRDGRESDSLRMSEAFWFSWGVILNSGLGEGTPRCLSSRVMSMIWAGFAMIIVASYTANLAAFLVLKDHGETISGINDPKLRNPVEDFRFGTVRGSAVDMFFRRKTEWANMYRVMEANNFDTAEEAIKSVKNGTLKAFIWDSSRLEFEASKNCDLVTVGDLFGRSGYGIGIRKGLFWSEKITLDILEFHESGFMADLDEKWIWEGEEECPPDRLNSPQRLGLANLEGIFMMIVGGVAIGIVLIIIELLYEKYKFHFTKVKAKSNPQKSVDDLNKGIKHSSAVSEQADRRESDFCAMCGENQKEENEFLCPYCMEIICSNPESYGRAVRDSITSWPEVESRIQSSPNIPEKLKKLSPKQWLHCKLKTKYPEEVIENVGVACMHDLSERQLHDMMYFVEENDLEEFPECPCHTPKRAHDEAPEPIDVSVCESNNDDSDSIISGEFSCPLLQEMSFRALESSLPDVIFNKGTNEDIFRQEDGSQEIPEEKIVYI